MNQLQQWFKTFVARLKGSHNVDVAVADFHKAIAKLEDVAALHNEFVKIHDKAAAKALVLKNKALEEEARAKALLTKFKDFLHV